LRGRLPSIRMTRQEQVFRRRRQKGRKHSGLSTCLAAEVEALVGCSVREHLGDPTESEDRDLIRNHVVRVEVQADQLLVGSAVREHLEHSTESADRDLIRNHVVRVEIQADQLVVELQAGASSSPPSAVDNERAVVRIPWKKTPLKRRREIIVPASASPHDRRPIRAETRVTLVVAIARGRRWLDEFVAGTVNSVEQIAAREKCSIRQVNMTISLAFLAPKLVQAVVPPIRDARFVDVISGGSPLIKQARASNGFADSVILTIWRSNHGHEDCAHPRAER
jgi:hypothetical protein